MSNAPRLSARERAIQQLQDIPEAPTSDAPGGQRQTLGPTKHARMLAADTPIKMVRKEPVENLRFRTGYERDPSEFESPAFDELVESIKREGINTMPVDVREVINAEEAYFEVLAGERRTRAIRKAGLPNVLIAIREVDNRTADRIHEIENGPRSAKAAYSRAVQYTQMLKEYADQQEMATHIGVDPSFLSKLLQLIRNAPPGLWDKVENAAALVTADVPVLLKAFEKDEFKKWVGLNRRAIPAKTLVQQARKLARAVQTEKPLEKEIFDRKRGDRYFVQLPKDVSNEDRKRIVDLVIRYFKENNQQ